MFPLVLHLSAENMAYNRLAVSTYTETVERVMLVDIISNSWRGIFILFYSFLSFQSLFICSPIYLAILYPAAVYLPEIVLRI